MWMQIRVGPIYWLADIYLADIDMYRQTAYQYRPYRYPHLYRLLWIPVISAYIGQNTSFQLNIVQNENIGIGGRYVGANI